MEDNFGIFTFIFCIVIGAIIFERFFGGKCCECGHLRAMEPTGRELDEYGLFSTNTSDEWKCKYCGHKLWKARQSPDGGSSGD